jgi:tetratricopeptide (TPR) repeat protein
MLESFDRLGPQDPSLHADARSFIVDSIPPLVGDNWDIHYKANAQDLATRGRGLLTRGCSDPLVLYLIAQSFYSRSSESREAAALYRRAIEGMKTASYPRAVARYAASGFYRIGRGYSWGEGNVPLLEMQWFRESLSDGSYNPGDDIVLVRQLTDGTGPSLVSRNGDAVVNALRAAPWVGEWLRLYISGVVHLEKAWQARGWEVADKVTDEQWIGFNKESVLARNELVRSYQLRPDRPEAAREMIEVTQAVPAPGETARTWFDRAIAAEFDYFPAYNSLLNSTLPRWGGSYQQMLAFGRECLATSRFDTQVPLVLINAVESIKLDQRSEMSGGGDPIYADPLVVQDLTRMLDRYLAERTYAADRELFESFRALVAFRSGDYASARKRLEGMDNRMNGDASGWLALEDWEPICRIAASGGVASKTVLKADALSDAGPVAPALAAYQQALKEDPSPQAACYFRRRIAALTIERALEGGGWSPFLPQDDALSGWEARHGEWKRERDGALVGTVGMNGLLLVSEARIGPDFEIRGHVELVSGATDQYQVGMLFGPLNRFRNNFSCVQCVGFSLQRNHAVGGVGFFSRGFDDGWATHQKVAIMDSNDLLVRFSQQHLSAVLNGKTIIHDLLAPEGLGTTPNGLIGLGNFYDDNGFTLRYTNVEVRRLGKPGRASAPAVQR